MGHPLRAGSFAKEGPSGGCHLTRAKGQCLGPDQHLPDPAFQCLCWDGCAGRPTRKGPEEDPVVPSEPHRLLFFFFLSLWPLIFYCFLLKYSCFTILC